MKQFGTIALQSVLLLALAFTSAWSTNRYLARTRATASAAPVATPAAHLHQLPDLGPPSGTVEVLTDRDVNLGLLVPEVPQKVSWTLKNSSKDKPLTVQVEKSCNCTQVTIGGGEKATIEPGEKAEIVGTYTPRQPTKSGGADQVQSAFVTVATSDPANRLFKLNLSAKVRPVE